MNSNTNNNTPSPVGEGWGGVIVDAHSHLWLKQDTVVDGQPIRTTTRGRSLFFGEEVQMCPPFMVDGKNSAEVFLANMDYAQVSAAVVVQEIIDGNQNEYLLEVQKKYPERFFVMGMPDVFDNVEKSAHVENVDHIGNVENVDIAEQTKQLHAQGFRGIAIPGHRYRKPLHTMMPMFREMEQRGMILSMCLDDNEQQIAEMKEIIQELPALKIAIGHFGMPTTEHWEQQILLARESPNVMVESGGITWLYNSEFYPYPTAIKSIKRAAELVGMDRLMWGSDYPRTITAITYRMSYDFVSKSSELTEEEKALFLGQNAQRFYGFTDLVELPYIKNMSE